jgi:O-antigen/teichoic acid export membrane protein
VSINNVSISRSVAEGTFWSSFYGFISKIVAIVAAVVVLRHLSISEYGLAELSMSLFSMLSIFLLPGIIQVIISDMSRMIGVGKVGEAKEIAINFFLLQLFLCVPVFFLVLIMTKFISPMFTANVINSITILSFSFLLTPFRSFVTLIFSVRKNFFAQGLFSSTEELFRLIIIVAMFRYTGFRLESVFFGSIGGQLLSLVVVLPLFIKSYAPIREALKTKTQSIFELLLKHGKWSVFTSYFNTFGQNIRLWIIQVFLGTNAVSVFSLALNMFIHTQSLITVSGVLAPIVSEHIDDTKLINKIVSKAIKYQMIVYVLLGLGGIIFMPILVDLLFPKYKDSLGLYNILLVAIVPSAFAGILTVMFHAKKAQKNLFKSTAIKNMFIIIFSFIFIPIFGITGVALEYCLTLTLYVLERYLSLRRIDRCFKFKPSELMTYDEVDRSLVNKFVVNYNKYIK